MSLPLFVVDAFTADPFTGNPAAVCLLDQPRDDRWMQNLAAEMNLSETAFLLPEGNAYRLRWFTPAVEVRLCGHATLAAATILWHTGHVSPEAPIAFETLSGRLTARRTHEQSGDWITLDFPALACQPCDPPAGLIESLGVEPTAIGNYGMDYLCEVADDNSVINLRPDLERLGKLQTRGVIVTARASEARKEFDIVSRFFAPAAGVPEDPVTGSAHCALGPYWSTKLGKTELLAWQASKRGGLLRVSVRGDRVGLAGRSVVVWRGELLV